VEAGRFAVGGVDAVAGEDEHARFRRMGGWWRLLFDPEPVKRRTDLFAKEPELFVEPDLPRGSLSGEPLGHVRATERVGVKPVNQR
jgi:hypothetical protein